MATWKRVVSAAERRAANKLDHAETYLFDMYNFDTVSRYSEALAVMEARFILNAAKLIVKGLLNPNLKPKDVAKLWMESDVIASL